ncbi:MULTISPECIES: SigB/SigF/SigG family RNA polymerase sigma factor [Micromonospora]|uniref:SigB/SigF/SigG family RNA polymerase sigma factor n=1 Tax=Micromonospora chalcea TaxID=1874 RepID=A0ABX9Y8P5_MICCH|nr:MULTISPECIES: SigB/SigF/SigG family RNA polymerase sigma factor [Micromonospora]EWM66194.1 stress response/stationary phase sigma factor SigF [Micromonospora sp. M42]MBQ1060895.1 SigB/SigF/SigG family RNA polymerase sigma factor [Micromonospora sp. C41]MCK1805110.1 SigB/SigF/SigG family RNA polymerase sigma factor [Micromonospora sp. R42106]MCK1829934.1 SigB/SigF/SigG family RNA polymerase sigma factor [Micromonospora sp. R42003]MCK1842015.1 SigB/SigF/SigG family RNA polymerase sigma factor
MVTSAVTPTATFSPPTPNPASGINEDMLRRRAALTVDDPERVRLRNRVIEANLPMACRLARRYTGRGESYDDLAQIGALGLIKAVDGYDGGRGVPFAAYAVPTILGGIRKHFRDSAWAIRVPRPTQELGARVPEARGRLAQQHGRQPTDRELADDLEVTVAQVLAAVVALGVYRLASLNEPRLAADRIERHARSGTVDAGYAAVDDHLTLGPLLAALPPRELRILTMRFTGDLTQAQIAARVGLSQMHVSRLLKRSLAQLRTGLLR